MEFTSSRTIPSEDYASPNMFDKKLGEYRLFAQQMANELNIELRDYQISNNITGGPYLVIEAQRQVHNIIEAIDYVISKKPSAQTVKDPVEADIDLIIALARRFHEAVLGLKYHPHGGTTFAVGDEWDSQYLFRAILAAYFPDVREEEWNPSVAGNSTRCEFFVKPLRTMIELKYARKATDAKKFKGELATDFVDYGGNQQVDHLICLVYDPNSVITTPASFQNDLSGPKTGLKRVEVILSPPRN